MLRSVVIGMHPESVPTVNEVYLDIRHNTCSNSMKSFKCAVI